VGWGWPSGLKKGSNRISTRVIRPLILKHQQANWDGYIRVYRPCHSIHPRLKIAIKKNIHFWLFYSRVNDNGEVILASKYRKRLNKLFVN
jgi:hypothetical protein